jgi:hypothetical protein
MPARASTTYKPNRCRTTNSISASRGKDSSTRIRSRSTGSARAWGHQADLSGCSCDPRAFLGGRFLSFFRSAQHQIPSLITADGEDIISQVPLEFLSVVDDSRQARSPPLIGLTRNSQETTWLQDWPHCSTTSL